MATLTETIEMPRKDATYYNRLGGLHKLEGNIDKNKSVCSVPVKTAKYLKRLGGVYKAYAGQAQTTSLDEPQQEQPAYNPTDEII